MWRTLALWNSLDLHAGSVSVAARTPISKKKNVLETSLNLVAELAVLWYLVIWSATVPFTVSFIDSESPWSPWPRGVVCRAESCCQGTEAPTSSSAKRWALPLQTAPSEGRVWTKVWTQFFLVKCYKDRKGLIFFEYEYHVHVMFCVHFFRKKDSYMHTQTPRDIINTYTIYMYVLYLQHSTTTSSWTRTRRPTTTATTTTMTTRTPTTPKYTQ